MCLSPFLVGKARQLKSSALLWIVTILWTNFEMAASQSEQPSVERALEQIADIEVEEEGESDLLEGLGNQEIAKIYHQLSPEDRQLFRQFKAFHKLHYDLYGHDAPSYQLTRGIIQNMFSGIPAHDAEVMAKARAEILAAEQIKELCKQLGLAVPVELQQLQPRKEAPEYPPPPPPLRFPSQQEKQRQQEQLQAAPQPGTSEEEEDVKPDIKPPRRLATTFLGKPGLLRMIGAGDDDHIITKVVPGTDPMQDFEEDDPTNVIVIEHETEESDVDDLSEVSMKSADAMSGGELQGLLANLAAAQQKTAEAIDALAARTSEMSTEQVGDAAAAVVTEVGHIKGLQEITKAFDKSEIALVLAVGVRKLHEYQCLKGQREEEDILPYSQLEKRFGVNCRTIVECSQGYKYRYPKGVPTKVQFTLTKPEREEEGQAATSTAKPT